MSPIVHPDIWLHCQLSIARHFGGVRVNGKEYAVDKSGYLVREDFLGVVKTLGINTVELAVNRYKDADHARYVCQRLARIKKTKKRMSQTNDCVLF